jgi:hypothetical protein
MSTDRITYRDITFRRVPGTRVWITSVRPVGTSWAASLLPQERDALEGPTDHEAVETALRSLIDRVVDGDGVEATP